jgi:hypothetical protein
MGEREREREREKEREEGRKEIKENQRWLMLMRNVGWCGAWGGSVES